RILSAPTALTGRRSKASWSRLFSSHSNSSFETHRGQMVWVQKLTNDRGTVHGVDGKGRGRDGADLNQEIAEPAGQAARVVQLGDKLRIAGDHIAQAHTVDRQGPAKLWIDR